MTFSHTGRTGGALVLLALTLLLNGCGPATPTKPPEPEVPVDAEAMALFDSGQYQAAADAYTALLAGAEPLAATRYRLMVAESLQEAGLNAAAAAQLQSVDVATASQEQLSWLAVLQVRGRDAEPMQVINQLGRLPVEQLPVRLRDDYFRLLASANDQQGDALASARYRSELDRYLSDPEQRRANHEGIWSDLNRLPESLLMTARERETDPLRGWVELLLLSRNPAGDLASALEDWQLRNPGHPASETLVRQMLEYGSQFSSDATRVALLLPAEGRFAAAAAAIRDGFMSAWLSDNAALRPQVKLYDASIASIQSAYDQAVADGAEIIVGPLEKAAVESLQQRAELEIPTLALNTVDDAAGMPGRLLQFGLSPEGEAEQAAQRAWADGHRQALILVPTGDWGARVEQAFRQRWTSLGGIVLDNVSYPANNHDYSPHVARLLNADQSRERRKALQARLGETLEFELRRRQDADFVFLAAYPNQARQIRPQLRFYMATQLPVYATSHVFSGRVNTTSDIDMDGITFGDMPWLLDPARRDNQLFASIQASWPDTSRSLARLYALGVDAYRVLPELNQLRVQSTGGYQGQSGILSLGAGGRIERQLTWARFDQGRPQLVGKP